MMLKVMRLRPGVQLPRYGRPGDAGMDLYAAEGAMLQPGCQVVVQTGIAVEIPEGYVGLIWDRSGMAAKFGITTMAGVVDCTYRGEIGVVLMNVGRTPYQVQAGDRIAQMLIQPVVTAQIEETAELRETGRGGSGFGSSGK